MKQLTNLMVSMVSLMLFFTSASIAKKQFVPIVIDDMISFASYNTSINKLKPPILTEENGYKGLIVQCEDDIAYFIAAYNVWRNYWNPRFSVNINRGNMIIEKEGPLIDDDFTSDYIIKGYVESTESINIFAELYDSSDANKLSWKVTQTCRDKSTSKNKLKVPTFNGNGQGKLVIQCETDAVYYIMAYDCLRWDTNPSVTTDNGIAVTDEKKHVGVKGDGKRGQATFMEPHRHRKSFNH